MSISERHESYPLKTILISNGLSLGIYVLGASILLHYGWVVFFLYIVYCFWREMQIIRTRCKYCYYYGKLCGLGKGRVCSLFIEKGDPARFYQKEICWQDLIPDMAVVLIPFITGIGYLLFMHFRWIILLQIILMLFLAFPGTGYVRSVLLCNHCKQAELGCPAIKFFGGENKNS